MYGMCHEDTYMRELRMKFFAHFPELATVTKEYNDAKFVSKGLT